MSRIGKLPITVPKGGSIAVTNNGTVAHNVAVTDTALKTRDFNGGESVTLDLSELEPGTYELFCAVNDEPSTLVETTEKTTCVYKGAQAGSMYSFQVRAVNKTAKGPFAETSPFSFPLATPSI